MQYELKATNRTPWVKVVPSENIFFIKGRSLPENGIVFFEPLVEWMQAQFSANPVQAQLAVQLEYCNTSSYKGLMLVFKAIEALNSQGNTFSILWIYDEDDEDWLEDGETYEELVNVPFSYQAVPAKTKVV